MAATDDVFLTHQQPVWRSRADFIVMAPLAEHHTYEQIWARQEADDLFEICCIPFFAHNLSLGDLVRTEMQGERSYLISDVVRPSGRSTFRVWLGKSPDDRLDVEAEFIAMGALTEWSSEHLLALDVPDEPQAQVLATRLAAGEQSGRWLYETGRL
ncbi:MAG: DUF4265 domain-containing protein [Frankiaceae bacterium]|nr:DUF4265 domain-containing protein [Frankiaceae bacterium]